ncbi:hypothetical protein Y032_0021g400 [Ancylostoma ceylanicum]|uniref:Uncharacterized protein n=1 Tax=Ancylostoma ceylanicum TaxID=53326 RepID=A0A016UZX7_9BILA|nr:hypothetical protein Y032_0021g400 [Ancylostoma ceylanicum]
MQLRLSQDQRKRDATALLALESSPRQQTIPGFLGSFSIPLILHFKSDKQSKGNPMACYTATIPERVVR